MFKFCRTRLGLLMKENGFQQDVIEAVLECNPQEFVAGLPSYAWAKPLDARARMQALQKIRQHPNFEPLSIAFKRARNILSQARKTGVAVQGLRISRQRLAEPAEQALADAVLGEEFRTRLAQEVDRGDYLAALNRLVALKDPVDTFFDKVLVMAPDIAVRDNRLALLAEVAGVFLQIADISYLAPSAPVPSAPKK